MKLSALSVPTLARRAGAIVRGWMESWRELQRWNDAMADFERQRPDPVPALEALAAACDRWNAEMELHAPCFEALRKMLQRERRRHRREIRRLERRR